MFETPERVSCTLHGTLFLTYSTDDEWISDEWWERRIEDEKNGEECHACTD